jgi:hypothetical protein
MHLGVRRSDFFRAMKNASCNWFSACKPCSHGKTCFVDGSGWVAM